MDKIAATNTIVEMLSVNERHGFSYPFDSSAWGKVVTPRLECNVYRKRFPAVQDIRAPSTLAAVLARALAHVSNKPSPVFMLLRQNGDMLSSYLDK